MSQPNLPKDDLDEILEQYIVFGQKQETFKCARCGAGTDDNSQTFCWCTDRDSSGNFDSPNWIDNVNYPRYIEAKEKAKARLIEWGKRQQLKARKDEAKHYCDEGHYHDSVRDLAMLPSERVKELAALQRDSQQEARDV